MKNSVFGVSNSHTYRTIFSTISVTNFDLRTFVVIISLHLISNIRKLAIDVISFDIIDTGYQKVTKIERL